MAKTRTRPGEPYPLGATWDGSGVNFALFSENATRVELCLFGPDGSAETARIVMPEATDQVWHVYLPDARPGQRYGYRVHGPWEPAQGHRFNPSKLLLDPYARAIDGTITWDDALFSYELGHPEADLKADERDSAENMPKAFVVDTSFTWGNDQPSRRPWNETIIYEVHVKGFTQRHPEVPEELRGTYAGLTSPAAVEHLKKLGVTAVELMPVHQFVSDRYLKEKGLSNYWGYNSIGFFAPDFRYARNTHSGGQVNEFKTMVKTLHEAGIEVILDVVYNHTAEGNHLGPTFCFRGIDNAAYYRLNPEDRRYYMDYTGCGNTLNMTHPRTLQLIMDSLRYWIQEMHVDGFRFDLASALARELNDVDRLGAFFDIIHQDPVISRVKLIAEPWDLGEGGYQVGNFPVLWAEWNGMYRDTVRAYWKGDESQAGPMGHRLTGSSDLYGHGGRRPYASINFVTAHDGFTLHDLVSYNDKHNEANGEDNRDGHDHNLSWNHGVEGPTDDPAIVALRERQKRNFLATLMIAQGVPMITAGDEVSRTQRGNNNAYCQDNEINWHDWYWDDPKWKLLNFTKKLIRLRRSHPIFGRRDFFHGVAVGDGGRKDVAWLKPDGNEMGPDDWNDESRRCLGMWLHGEQIPETDERGQALRDASFLGLFNAGVEAVDFELPHPTEGVTWIVEIDTAHENGEPPPSPGPNGKYHLEGRSTVLLRQAEAGSS